MQRHTACVILGGVCVREPPSAVLGWRPLGVSGPYDEATPVGRQWWQAKEAKGERLPRASRQSTCFQYRAGP